MSSFQNCQISLSRISFIWGLLEDGVLRKEPTEGVSLNPCFDDLMKFRGRWGNEITWGENVRCFLWRHWELTSFVIFFQSSACNTWCKKILSQVYFLLISWFTQLSFWRKYCRWVRALVRVVWWAVTQRSKAAGLSASSPLTAEFRRLG